MATPAAQSAPARAIGPAPDPPPEFALPLLLVGFPFRRGPLATCPAGMQPGTTKRGVRPFGAAANKHLHVAYCAQLCPRQGPHQLWHAGCAAALPDHLLLPAVRHVIVLTTIVLTMLCSVALQAPPVWPELAQQACLWLHKSTYPGYRADSRFALPILISGSPIRH